MSKRQRQPNVRRLPDNTAALATGGTARRWLALLTTSWRAPVLIAAAAVAIYLPSVHFGFTELDDYHLVVTDAPFLHAENVLRAFRTDVFWNTSGLYYRPVLNLSLMADAWWGGTSPWPYHCINIVLHALCALLVWWLARLLRGGNGRATATALLFAVHPLTAQTVAWIPGRNDLLLALWLLLAVGYWVRYLQSCRWQWLALHLFCFGLALFTKETAIVLPVLALALLLVERRWIGAVRILLPAAGWTCLMVVWFLLRRVVVPAAGSTLPRTEVMADAVNGVLLFTGKTLLPFNQSVLPVPPDINPLWGLAVAAALAVMVAVGGVASWRRSCYWAAWCLMLLAPTLARYGPFIDYMENRLYLPLAGFLLLMGEFNVTRMLRGTRWMLPVFILWLMFMATLAARHQRAFATSGAFWEDAARTSPGSFFARGMLGREYHRQRRLDDAEKQYQLCVGLNPSYRPVYGDLGFLYSQRGQYDKALPAWRRAAQLMPDDPDLAYDLAVCYLKLSRPAEAERWFRRALVLQPKMADAAARLGLVLLQRDQPNEAIPFLWQAAVLLPADDQVFDHLARAYAMADSMGQASACYRRSLELGGRPDSAFINMLSARVKRPRK